MEEVGHYGSETANTFVLFDQKTERLLSFNPKNKKWSKMKKVPGGMKFGFTSLVMGKDLYALSEKKMFRLKNASSKWTELQGTSEDHGFWPRAVALNGSIYVCGGRRNATRFVEKYQSGKWCTGVPMNIARQETCPVVAQGCIYCIGGHDENEKLIRSVEKFDEKTEKWSEIESIPRPTYFTSGSAVGKDGFIYVADCAGIQILDIQNNSWTTLEPDYWPRPGNYYRMETDITVVNDELHVIFNFLSEGIEIYQVDQKTGKMTLVEERKNIWISFTKSFTLNL